MKGHIFIVGFGRSGTTLLYHMLCRHRDVGWFSNLTDHWPYLPLASALSAVFPAPGRQRAWSRFLPIPSEGYPFWNDLCRIDRLPMEGPLDERDLSSAAQTYAASTVARLLRYQQKGRFINKATRNTRRIRYVDALFEDSRFINVIRDPRATVGSLLRVPFWPTITVWSEGGITPREWEAKGKDPVELAARLWVSDVARSLEDKESLPSDSYLEVRYESLVEDPPGTIADVAAFAGLPMTPAFDRALHSFAVVNQNVKIETQLSSGQLATILRVTEPLAKELGYAL